MESSSDNDFVTVDMPTSRIISDDSDDIEAAQHHSTKESSLLKLWSEATSTTDLPAPPIGDHRLHHRRAKVSPREGSSTSRNNKGTSPSKRRITKSRYHRGAGSNRRSAKIGKQLWLTAFAAFATSILIVIHLFLYDVFISSSSGGDSRILEPGSNEKSNTKQQQQQILSPEDLDIKMTLDEVHTHTITPLHSIDKTQFTIRINTWRRNEQLLLSINHHSQCDNVKEIQVIWCDIENEVPDSILHHGSGKVKVEKHVVNSLNERFKVLIDTPTLGILSLDDDVLRPCIALDTAFIRWTNHPERMVGFDARTHVVIEDEDDEVDSPKEEDVGKWKYGYMSTTESSNRYSITLPRASFIHRDYLDLYIMALPREIYKYVAKNLECEDIAMSFFVSSLTSGKPPLLANYWAVKSMVKLYSAKKISGGSEHKSTRDACVNDFAELLGLKNDNGDWPLHTDKLLHTTNQFFGYGTEPEDWSRSININDVQSDRLKDAVKKMKDLQTQTNEERIKWLGQVKTEVAMEANSVGMIENTPMWKKRWKS